MMDTWQTFRDGLVQELMHGLERDLSDLPNLSNVRNRFIPRHALMEIISQQKVVKFLERLPIRHQAEHTPPRNAVSQISPRPGGCRCGIQECTGARAIFSILLLIGREDLITTFIASETLCDGDLLSSTSSWDAKESTKSREQNRRSPPQHKAITDLYDNLDAKEKDLFAFWQWQVLSPYMTPLDHENGSIILPDEICLPWQEIEWAKEALPGGISYVQKVKIFPDNHNLVSVFNFIQQPSGVLQ